METDGKGHPNPNQSASLCGSATRGSPINKTRSFAAAMGDILD